MVVTEFLWDERLCSKQNDQNNNALEYGLPQNVFNHFSWNDVLLLSIRWSEEQLGFWSLGCKSEGCKWVHDEVDPEQLNSSKWALLENKRANQANKQSDNINWQLELQKSPDIVVNISTPRASFDNRSKVIVLNDDVWGSVSYLSSSSHGETNIGLP